MIRVWYKDAQWHDSFGGLGVGSKTAGELIREYETWLEEQGVEYRYHNNPFVILVDDKYGETMIIFKLKFGL